MGERLCPVCGGSLARISAQTRFGVVCLPCRDIVAWDPDRQLEDCREMRRLIQAVEDELVARVRAEAAGRAHQLPLFH